MSQDVWVNTRLLDLLSQLPSRGQNEGYRPIAPGKLGLVADMDDGRLGYEPATTSRPHRELQLDFRLDRKTSPVLEERNPTAYQMDTKFRSTGAQ
ncbi:hypothetical protein HUJ04_001130 [Dendroctonus ponderosae]|nr:hypothetical protein HUJ04_001130 [Dendroctonus ponderosae]